MCGWNTADEWDAITSRVNIKASIFRLEFDVLSCDKYNNISRLPDTLICQAASVLPAISSTYIQSLLYARHQRSHMFW
jgi:hypothetical protein